MHLKPGFALTLLHFFELRGGLENFVFPFFLWQLDFGFDEIERSTESSESKILPFEYCNASHAGPHVLFATGFGVQVHLGGYLPHISS
jgi:hypothetical protein